MGGNRGRGGGRSEGSWGWATSGADDAARQGAAGGGRRPSGRRRTGRARRAARGGAEARGRDRRSGLDRPGSRKLRYGDREPRCAGAFRRGPGPRKEGGRSEPTKGAGGISGGQGAAIIGQVPRRFPDRLNGYGWPHAPRFGWSFEQNPIHVIPACMRCRDRCRSCDAPACISQWSAPNASSSPPFK